MYNRKITLFLLLLLLPILSQAAESVVVQSTEPNNIYGAAPSSAPPQPETPANTSPLSSNAKTTPPSSPPPLPSGFGTTPQNKNPLPSNFEGGVQNISSFAAASNNPGPQPEAPKFLNFTPPSTDVSVTFLTTIFGKVDGVLEGGGSQILGKMFSIFNLAILTLGGIILLYTLIVSTINTAHEGEVLGKKWSSIWIPLRSVIGVGLLIPKASGYSFIQILMMWIVMQGIGAADSVWSTALNYIGTGGSIISIPPVPPAKREALSGIEYTEPLVKSLICLYGVQKALDDARKAPPTPISPPPLPPVPNLLNLTVAPINGMESLPQNGVNKIPVPADIPGYPGYEGVCGNIEWSDLNAKPKAQLDAYHSRQVQSARGFAVRQMLFTMAPMARDIIYERIPPVEIGNELGKAMLSAGYDYQKLVDTAKFASQDERTISTQKDLLKQLSASGWAMAGSYFATLTEAKKIVPNPPEGGSHVSVIDNSDNEMKKRLMAANSTLFDDQGPISKQLITARGRTEGAQRWLDAYFYSGGNREAANQEGRRPPPTAPERDKELEEATAKYNSCRQFWSFSRARAAGADFAYLMSENVEKDGRLREIEHNLFHSIWTGHNKNQAGWDAAHAAVKRMYECRDVAKEYERLKAAPPPSTRKLMDSLRQTPLVNVLPSGTDTSGFSNVFSTLFQILRIFGAYNEPTARHPILAIADMGQTLTGTGAALWTYSAIAGIALTVATSVIPFTSMGTIGLAVNMWLLPMLNGLAGAAIVTGSVMSVYIPMIPFVIFTLGVIGWMTGILESMVAVPLAALGLMHPEGDETFGKAAPALMLIANVFLRPMLMLFGFIGAIVISYAGVYLLNTTFYIAMNSLFSNNTFVKLVTTGDMQAAIEFLSSLNAGIVVGGIVGGAAAVIANVFSSVAIVIGCIILHTLLSIFIIQKAFGLVSDLPQHILTWIGGVAHTPGGQFGQGAEAMEQKGERTAGEISGAVRPTGYSQRGADYTKPKQRPDQHQGGGGVELK